MPAIFELDNTPALENLIQHGYIPGGEFMPGDVRLWSDGRYVVAKKLMFHWTVLECDLANDFGPEDRWCYETYEGARDAVQSYPDDWPQGFEPPGWHRHPKTARRRAEANPEQEYIDP